MKNKAFRYRKNQLMKQINRINRQLSSEKDEIIQGRFRVMLVDLNCFPSGEKDFAFPHATVAYIDLQSRTFAIDFFCYTDLGINFYENLNHFVNSQEEDIYATNRNWDNVRICDYPPLKEMGNYPSGYYWSKKDGGFRKEKRK